MRVVALVDGEHYPSVTAWGLASARASGMQVVAAVGVGGVEKLASGGKLELAGIPVFEGSQDAMAALRRAIDEHRPDAVLDLSDEPVLTYRRRMELVAVALHRGVVYLGPGFRFEPPIQEAPLAVPAVGVIGTGKRVAKTAVGGHVARRAAAAGMRPFVVAMGRGGPPQPVMAGPRDVTLEALLARVEGGQHAASDYLEDALTAQVPTVGARRCGGGLAGRPFATNVAEAAALAVSSGAGMVILEGSGAAVPTVPWDAGVLVGPASIPLEYLVGYLGPLRVLLSDLLLLIMGDGPLHEGPDLPTLESQVRRLRRDIRVAVTELEPVPLDDVRGKDVLFATTAPPAIAERLSRALERSAGCRVVATTTNLSDRARLEEDLAAAPPFDALLTELKAAAVDVAARRALDRGADVVFVDNRPRSVGGGDEVDELVDDVLRLAADRGAARLGGEDR